MTEREYKRVLEALEAAQMYVVVAHQLGMDPRGPSAWKWFVKGNPLGDLEPTVKALVDLALKK